MRHFDYKLMSTYFNFNAIVFFARVKMKKQNKNNYRKELIPVVFPSFAMLVSWTMVSEAVFRGASFNAFFTSNI